MRERDFRWESAPPSVDIYRSGVVGLSPHSQYQLERGEMKVQCCADSAMESSVSNLAANFGLSVLLSHHLDDS